VVNTLIKFWLIEICYIKVWWNLYFSQVHCLYLYTVISTKYILYFSEVSMNFRSLNEFLSFFNKMKKDYNGVGLQFGPRLGTVGSSQKPKEPDWPMPTQCTVRACGHRAHDRCGATTRVGGSVAHTRRGLGRGHRHIMRDLSHKMVGLGSHWGGKTVWRWWRKAARRSSGGCGSEAVVGDYKRNQREAKVGLVVLKEGKWWG
jgi:hypothetical protein